MAATIDVNVANQAYPFPPPGSQALPTPRLIQVPDLPAIPSSFSSGVATPATPDNLVAAQNNTFLPPRDWIVTDNGNFQTSNNLPDLQNFTVNTVTTVGSGATGVYVLTLLQAGVTAKLENFGIDLTGDFAKFLTTAGQPTRPISFWSTSTIVVPQQDMFGNTLTAPVAGNAVQIAVIRQGPADVFDTNNAPTPEVLISPSPPVAATAAASGQVIFLGNIAATDGVVRPFIGEGQRLPPFIGTFEVEDQIPVGLGLPRNVFI